MSGRKKVKPVYRNPNFQVSGGAESILEMMDEASIKDAREYAKQLEAEGAFFEAAWARIVADADACVKANERFVDEGKLKKKNPKTGKPYNHQQAIQYCYDKDSQS
jgi:hypothetical protein